MTERNLDRLGFMVKGTNPSMRFGFAAKPELGRETRPEDEPLTFPLLSLEAMRGRYALIHIDGRPHAGIYQGTALDGAHVLRPGLHPRPEGYFENVSMRDRHVWLDEPVYIYGPIGGFQAISREMCESCGHGFESVANLGKTLDNLSTQ